MENRYFRLGIHSESGTLISLFDKRLGRDLVTASQPGNLFQVCYEKPHGMSAWRIGPISRTENLLGAATVRVARQGPVQAAIRVEHAFGKSKLNQEIVIHRDLPRIDFVTEIDWREVGGQDIDSPMLKVAFPWAHSSGTCVREIPFGHITSPANGEEVPSLTFLELPGEGFGVALLNDSKYGHDARGNTVRLTLLRAAYDPDPMPDIGRHRLVFSILPHEGDWKDAEVWKQGHALNTPLRVIPGKASDARRSWVSVDAPGVDLSALKRADDGRGIIVRLIEMNGRKVRVNLGIGWRASGLRKCDLRERSLSGRLTKVKGGKVALNLAPHEIGTWRIT
jgi:alpha-mannosidase